MGATIRIYAESFERDPERHNRETQVQTAPVENKSKQPKHAVQPLAINSLFISSTSNRIMFLLMFSNSKINRNTHTLEKILILKRCKARAIQSKKND